MGSAKHNDEKLHLSFLQYLRTELYKEYHLENDEALFAHKRARVYVFFTEIIPSVEKLIWYGFLQCLDAFLYMFSFLPLRILLALWKVFTSPHKVIWGYRVFKPSQWCDVLKGVILACTVSAMCYVDVSVIYHLVRGQAVIKLYIMFNMLEVADKLLSSIGQDILDSLFWTAAEKRSRKREHFGVLFHLCVAIVYVFLHTMLVLIQATTLNVAFNSHNKALLTIMMSNNFVELKGSVFKKFEKSNLFQMSCSDVRERFHYAVLLLIVTIRNMTEFQWNREHFWVLVPDIILVLLGELLVDWVKHAFITKFNEIPAEVYYDYRASLAYDMLGSRQKNAFMDHADVVSRRMGFIPLPLAVLLIRVISQSATFIFTPFTCFLVLLAYIWLITTKALVGVLILGTTHDIVHDHRAKMAARLRQRSGASATDTPAAEAANTNTGRGATPPPSAHRDESPNKRVYSKELLVGGQYYQSLASFTDLEPLAFQRPPLLRLSASRPLFANSTVSLNSLHLNEAVLGEGGEGEGTANSEGSDEGGQEKAGWAEADNPPSPRHRPLHHHRLHAPPPRKATLPRTLIDRVIMARKQRRLDAESIRESVSGEERATREEGSEGGGDTCLRKRFSPAKPPAKETESSSSSSAVPRSVSPVLLVEADDAEVRNVLEDGPEGGIVLTTPTSMGGDNVGDDGALNPVVIRPTSPTKSRHISATSADLKTKEE